MGLVLFWLLGLYSGSSYWSPWSQTAGLVVAFTGEGTETPCSPIFLPLPSWDLQNFENSYTHTHRLRRVRSMAGFKSHLFSHLPPLHCVLSFPQTSLEVTLSWLSVFSKSNSLDLGYTMGSAHIFFFFQILMPESYVQIVFCKCSGHIVVILICSHILRLSAQRLAASRLGSRPLAFVFWESILPIQMFLSCPIHYLKSPHPWYDNWILKCLGTDRSIGA